ncbi:MAG: 30S ribosomal protein S8 [Spirochaetia bacterium]|nr:30S ribosomal protein S8 [Spirochaetia bacterium]
MDPIADLLTRIRNGNAKKKDYVDVPSSKIKQNIVKLLKEEGFIKGYRYIEDNKQGNIRVYLKYGDNKEKAIHSIKRVSTSSRRVYTGAGDIRRIRNGIGTILISTSKGIMTGQKAREDKLGGEIICEIW